MMLKRLLLVAAVVVGAWGISRTGAARTPGGPTDVGPLGEEMCCRDGVPQIPAGQECRVLHQLGDGENLHILAAYYYGDARAWRRIWELNKNTIKNPNIVKQGQIIQIMVPACWTPRYDLFEFMQMERKRLEILQRAKEKATVKEHIKEEKLEAPTIIIGPSGGEEEKGEETGGPTEKPETSEPTPEPEPAPEPTPPSPDGGG